MKVYENLVGWSNDQVVVRVWMARTADGPDPEIEQEALAELLDTWLPRGETCRALAELIVEAFPAANAVEVKTAGTNGVGVLIYPDWP